MIEGELPEDGLAALEGDGQDILLTLARRLTDQNAGDGQLLESIFARRREAEAEADNYLAVGDWDVADVSPGSDDDVDSIIDLSHSSLSHPLPSDRDVAVGSPSDANGRLVSFDELARLIEKPKSRRKSAPSAQLTLFDG